MQKDQKITIVCLILLALAVFYLIVTMAEIIDDYMRLQNVKLNFDASMNIVLFYQGGQRELGSIWTLSLAILSTAAFILLLVNLLLNRGKN